MPSHRALVLAGLFLVACGPTPKAEPDPRANWYRDVQPIVAEHCGSCHVAGGITPFPLTSYDDVKEHSAVIADAVKNKRMPPWMPTSECNSYKDERRLTQAQIDTLVDFDKNGALQGDVKDQTESKLTRSELPWVDKTLKASNPYTPNQYHADKTRKDDYRCFILDPQLTGARDLIGFEVVPGDRREVHHVLLYTVTTAEAQKLEDASPEDGWQCFGGPGTSAPKMVGGWVPGTGVTRFPGSTGISLYAGDVLIMQVHYNLSQTTAVPDQTEVKLQYSTNPVANHAQMFPLVDNDFAIPPNAMGYSRTVGFELPVPATIWGLVPHMHTKGASVKVEMLPPKGKTGGTNTCLVDIPKWDFQWQQFYFYTSRTGIPLEANSELRLTCTWNNPTAKTVRWGESTDDEMCLAFIYVTGKI